MSKNLKVVKDYFKYCVDGKDISRVKEFFAENVIIHRTDCDEPVTGIDIFKQKLRECVTERYESLHTTFQKEIESGDEVVVALTHVAKGSNTWKGYDVTGKDLSWTSLTYFKFNSDGLIIEEIVERDELSMAQQLGIVNFDKF